MSRLLCDALTAPAGVAALAPERQTALVARARRAGLLATLCRRMEAADVLRELPPAARRHYESARLMQDKQQRDLRFALSQLAPVLDAIDARLILLKGAAYTAGGLDAGRGRLISDIDLLTPRHRIAQVEQALVDAGWERAGKSAYDERYYRRWMHEIPPLRHGKRGTVLDVHHTILPPTAAPKLPVQPLFDDVEELQPGLFALGAADRVLHSVAHLLFESEFNAPLRDLWDQRCLIVEALQRDPGFWAQLRDRARLMDLETPLWLALRYLERHFALRAPAAVGEALRPPLAALRCGYWDPLFRRAFSVDPPPQQPRFHGLAHTLLYLRGHALRMPPQLLLPHLLRKSLQRWSGEAPAP